MTNGTIIVLNGAPRSGKSTLAKQLQKRLPGVWLIDGVDALMAATPQAIQPGIGLRPGGERPELEPVIKQLYRGLFASIAAYSRNGINVIADLDIHDSYRVSQQIWPLMQANFSELPLLLVGVTAPIAVIAARRLATWQQTNGEAAARLWEEAVHAGHHYALWVDTAAKSPQANAKTIAQWLLAQGIVKHCQDML